MGLLDGCDAGGIKRRRAVVYVAGLLSQRSFVGRLGRGRDQQTNQLLSDRHVRSAKKKKTE